MQRLTSAFLLTFLLFNLTTARADEKNGLRVNVQKKIIDRNDFRAGSEYYDTAIDRTMGLKVTVVNTSMKPTPERTVEYSMLVHRWGYSQPRFDRFAGTQKLQALKPAETADIIVGSSHVSGYGSSDHTMQDKVEAWKIVIREGATEVFKQVSGPNFDAIDKRAQDAPVSRVRN